jgi:hypothetical protein
MGNRTGNLQACRIVPQPTTLPRAQGDKNEFQNCSPLALEYSDVSVCGFCNKIKVT